MLRSMTGFGHAERVALGYKIQIDLRSVNHRYSEIVVRMPREWQMFEDPLRKMIQQSVKRGRIDVFVTVEKEPDSAAQPAVNWPLIESWIAAADMLRERLGLPESESLKPRDLLLLPDILLQSEDRPEDIEKLRAELESCAQEAVEQLVVMRETEGRYLQQELAGRLMTVGELREAIVREAPEAVEHMRRKLRERIHELLEDTGKFDEQRFVMEVAILADRANIDEELARLSSHCQQFLALLDSDEPVGRKLDFLIQEMNREANTIGSKANLITITNLVVELKAELEKLREQVQNIE